MEIYDDKTSEVKQKPCFSCAREIIKSCPWCSPDHANEELKECHEKISELRRVLAVVYMNGMNDIAKSKELVREALPLMKILEEDEWCSKAEEILG